MQHLKQYQENEVISYPVDDIKIRLAQMQHEIDELSDDLAEIEIVKRRCLRRGSEKDLELYEAKETQVESHLIVGMSDPRSPLRVGVADDTRAQSKS